MIPVDQTYCARMLKGEIPNIVPDVAAQIERAHGSMMRMTNRLSGPRSGAA